MQSTVNFKFSNGDKVREVVSGLEGIITGSVSYLTGCNQHLVTLSPKDSYSEPTLIWYDDSRLELIKDQKVKIEIDGDPGFDIQAPKK